MLALGDFDVIRIEAGLFGGQFSKLLNRFHDGLLVWFGRQMLDF